MENQSLMVLARDSGVDSTVAQTVLESFKNFFDQASEWERKTKSLIITDVSQVAEMATAREGRLALKEIRCNAEKTRKKLKEDIVVRGRFIDSIYNLIEGITKPIEADLLEKEKFIERQEQARIDAIKKDRIEKLSAYDFDSSFYDLGNMPDSAFDQLLNNAKVAAELKEQQRIQAEKDRIEAERIEAEERTRIAEENARLKAEAAEREKQLEQERAKAAFEREKAEAERKAAEQKAREEREAIEAAERERQREAEKKIKEAQEAAAEAMRKLQEKAEAEAISKRAEEARIEAERKARADEAEKLAKAGDRIKMLKYISDLESVSIQPVDSQAAQVIIDKLIEAIANAKVLANRL